MAGARWLQQRTLLMDVAKVAVGVLAGALPFLLQKLAGKKAPTSSQPTEEAEAPASSTAAMPSAQQCKLYVIVNKSSIQPPSLQFATGLHAVQECLHEHSRSHQEQIRLWNLGKHKSTVLEAEGEAKMVELEDTAKKMGLSTHAGFSGNGERAGKNKFKLLIIGPGADSVIRPITAGLSLLHY